MNYSKALQEIGADMSLLYVEDDREIAEIAKIFLSDYFGRVDYSEDGKIALERYDAFNKEHGSTYDIIVTDINMPHLNGIEFSKQVLEINPLQPIIVVSAHDDSNYLLELINMGVDGFVLKPMQFQFFTRVLYKVANHVYEKRLLNLYIEQLEKSDRISSTIAVQSVNLKSSHIKEAPLDQDLLEALLDDIDELHEWLDIIDAAIITALHDRQKARDAHSIDTLAENLLHYCGILSRYHEFNTLVTSLRSLAETMKVTPLPEDDKKVEEIYVLLESFIYVLAQLGERIKKEQFKDIKFFDASLSQDLETIRLRWEHKEIEGKIDFF